MTHASSCWTPPPFRRVVVCGWWLILFTIKICLVGGQTLTPTIAPTTAAPTTLTWMSIPIATTGTSYSFSTGAINNDGSCVTLGTSNGATLFSRQSNGGSFTENTVTSSTGSNSFSSISMSLNGQYQVALYDSTSILISANNGLTWTKTSQGLSASNNANGWMFSAMSDDGYFIFLAQAVTTPPTFAFYRDDSSSTWSPSFQVSSTATPTIAGSVVVAIGMDSQGQTLVFVDSSQYLYVSYTYGSTWKINSATSTYTPLVAFTMSRSTGSRNAVAVMGQQYYTTDNLGKSWTSHYTPDEIDGNTFTSMTGSYTGQYLMGMIKNNSYSSAPGGLYLSSDYGESWQFLYPSSNDVIPLINPAGNYLAFVTKQSSVTPKLYYSQPMVPTMTPTMYPPTMKPTPTSAPFSPITSPIAGWVTNNHFANGTCTGLPAVISGYPTNTCIKASLAKGTVLSVMYICDTESIVMYEYSDNACQNQVPTTKSYVNGAYMTNAEGECVTQMTCTAATYSLDVVPTGIEYGAAQYYSDQCVTQTSFEAILNDVCIPLSSSSSQELPYQSMKMLYPVIHLYQNNTDCTGPYTISNYFNPIVYDYDYNCYLVSYGEASSKSAYRGNSLISTVSDPLVSFSIVTRKYTQRNGLNQDQRHGLRRRLHSSVADSTIKQQGIETDYFDDDLWSTDDYYFDDTHVSFYLYNQPIYPIIFWDDDWTVFNGGVIAGVVIGSVCGCCIISLVIYFLVKLLFGIGKAVNNSRPPVEANVSIDPPIVTVYESGGSKMGAAGALEMHATANPILHHNANK